MASSLILVPFYMCFLGLMCCGSVADSRAVYFRDGRSAQHHASLSEEFDIDDGPETFTMQDHFNWLKARELARRVRDSTPTGSWGTVQSKMDASVDEELSFPDYHDPDFNHIHDLPKT